jgi:predicted branched-subunit amino acid permease
MSSPSKCFIDGVRAELPILIGVIPFGMIYGVLALEAGLTAAQTQAMSAIVFAGSAQIVLTQLVNVGAPALVMILTVLVVNLRHALYSASMAPYLQRLRPTWKWLLGYLLTDEAYVASAIYYQQTDRDILQAMDIAEASGHPSHLFSDQRHWFFLGAGLALWAAWQLSSLAGILVGAIIPETWSLDFTLALTFIALVVPNLKDRAMVSAALAAGLASLVAYSSPYKLGLIIAAVVGVGCGLLMEGKK